MCMRIYLGVPVCLLAEDLAELEIVGGEKNGSIIYKPNSQLASRSAFKLNSMFCFLIVISSFVVVWVIKCLLMEPSSFLGMRTSLMDQGRDKFDFSVSHWYA